MTFAVYIHSRSLIICTFAISVVLKLVWNVRSLFSDVEPYPPCWRYFARMKIAFQKFQTWSPLPRRNAPMWLRKHIRLIYGDSQRTFKFKYGFTYSANRVCSSECTSPRPGWRMNAMSLGRRVGALPVGRPLLNFKCAFVRIIQGVPQCPSCW